jgi:hypothetical protein
MSYEFTIRMSKHQCQASGVQGRRENKSGTPSQWGKMQSQASGWSDIDLGDLHIKIWTDRCGFPPQCSPDGCVPVWLGRCRAGQAWCIWWGQALLETSKFWFCETVMGTHQCCCLGLCQSHLTPSQVVSSLLISYQLVSPLLRSSPRTSSQVRTNIRSTLRFAGVAVSNQCVPFLPWFHECSLPETKGCIPSQSSL